MIGACDICSRQNVPVSHFRADQTSAQCETSACFLCQGEDDPDPYGEIEEIARLQTQRTIETQAEQS
jgi:hypothetical protein